MNCHTTDPIAEAIAYIESHLDQNLNLERVADAVHYSRYHLHRMFTAAAGMTLHDYIRRRKLTEAARLLVFSQLPVIQSRLLRIFSKPCTSKALPPTGRSSDSIPCSLRFCCAGRFPPQEVLSLRSPVLPSMTFRTGWNWPP